MNKDEQKKKLTVEEEAERNEKLLEYKGPDQVVPASEIWQKVKARGVKKGVIKSGFSDLDKNIGGGFYPGQLVTISGVSGEGKTTLCRSFTSAFIPQGVNPLWFSYEETDEQFLSKFPERTFDYFYMPKELTDKKPEWIEQRILESKLKYGTKVVLVDHLHFLIDFYMKNTSLEIGAIVRKLKLLAVEHKITFFLIAHIGKTDRSRELEQGDIRDSGMIEADSDLVMYVWRKGEGGEDVNIVKITKNRETGIKNFKIPLYFNPATKTLYPTANFEEHGGTLWNEKK